MPYKVENERKRRRKQEGHFCLPEYLIWSITGEAISFAQPYSFLDKFQERLGVTLIVREVKKYYYCFIILLAMLWWVNGVIHRKNSFATFPAKLYTPEATLSFKNYKQKKKQKQIPGSSCTIHRSLHIRPFPPISFLVVVIGIDTPKSGTYRETGDHLFRLAQGR